MSNLYAAALSRFTGALRPVTMLMVDTDGSALQRLAEAPALEDNLTTYDMLEDANTDALGATLCLFLIGLAIVIASAFLPSWAASFAAVTATGLFVMLVQLALRAFALARRQSRVERDGPDLRRVPRLLRPTTLDLLFPLVAMGVMAIG